MARDLRWLAAAAALTFLGLIVWWAFRQDPDFWRSATSLYKSAKEAEERGELSQALQLAEKAWSRDPGNFECGTFLGWLYLKAGTPQKGLEILQQVWARDPQALAALKGQAWALERLDRHPEALSLLADFLLRQPENVEILQTAAEIAALRPEDRELAVSYYQRLYRLRPDPWVRRTLVDLLCSLQRFREAIPLQEEETAQFPENQEALHRLALLYYWQRDYQAASEVYRRLLEKAADDATLRQEAARTADAAQNLDEAIKHYLWLYGREQGKAEYALKLARLWAQKGNHPEAAAVLGPLLQEDPKPDLQRWYALELLLSGDYDQARKEYRRAWEAGDTHKETIINLARLYGQNQQFSKAAAMWDEAARRQLVQGELRWEAALAYSYAQRYADALDILQPVARDHPKYPRIQVFLGQMHFYQKHWGQAAHYFKAYLEKHPEDLEVRRLLAEALAFKTDGRDEAIDEYGELLKRTDDPNLRLRRAALLLEAHRWKEAREELNRCPRSPELLKEQARLFLWLGDLEEARNRYEEYLALNPQDRGALLDKARVLTHLGRSREAREILKSLGGFGTGQAGLSPENRAVLVAAIEAALAARDWPEAGDLALRLYSAQFPDKGRPPRDWREACRWQEEEKTAPALKGTRKVRRVRFPDDSEKDEEGLPSLTLAERTWVARALLHTSDPQCLNLAADLLVDNLQEDRYHHPSLLLLQAILPRLPRYEDLSRLVYRIPGIKADSPEYVASLAYFTGNLGRHGGKLDYLLHALREYRNHRKPKDPGQLLGLADLAKEVGDGKAAEEYYRLASAIRPDDPRISQLLLNCQLSQKDWPQALATVQKEGIEKSNPLELARLYLLRGQYEGVKAAVARIPENHPDRPRGLLLKAQACRLERNFPEALKALEQAQGRVPPEEFTMEKAQVLEAMGDKAALALYRQIIQAKPGSPLSRVAEARRARAAGNWVGAYRAYAKALEDNPQDIQLLNELEYVRQQMRPQAVSRAFAHPQGERRPEELLRPWQFSRFERDFPGISLTNRLNPLLGQMLSRQPFGATVPEIRNIPFFQPETFWFQDSNKLRGLILAGTVSGLIRKTLPVHLGVEYRAYSQSARPLSEAPLEAGPDKVFSREAHLRRLQVSLGAGPVSLTEGVSLRGELGWRRYWQKLEDFGQKFYPFPDTAHSWDDQLITTFRETRDRLVGSLELDFPLGARTDACLRYSRLDLLDQDPKIFPRLYQGILKLGEFDFITLHQVEFNFHHQFRPDWDWRGSVAGAFFSDDNRRLTFYQGLYWLVLRQPQMHLGITPHYYLAAYREQKPAYFSPRYYHALGVGVDFDRQIFRLPTLILQGTVQAVGQHGEWGPAFHGLAALEWELVQNFFIDPHVFYFREWVDNYRILSFGLSLRYRF